jgi:hypothetical protein
VREREQEQDSIRQEHYWLCEPWLDATRYVTVHAKPERKKFKKKKEKIKSTVGAFKDAGLQESFTLHGGN